VHRERSCPGTLTVNALSIDRAPSARFLPHTVPQGAVTKPLRNGRASEDYAKLVVMRRVGLSSAGKIKPVPARFLIPAQKVSPRARDDRVLHRKTAKHLGREPFTPAEAARTLL
jgi:hypothetical protein